MQVVKNGCEHILFRTDVYFNEYLLAVESNERKHVDRDKIFSIFEEKKQKRQKRNLVVNLLKLIRVKKVMMQTMKLVEYKHLSVNLERDN